MRWAWLATALAALLPGAAQAGCRLALVLALDVSASVDEREYALQTGGVASALIAPEVQAAILADTDNPVWLSVFEWSSPFGQTTLLDWRALSSPAAILAAAEAVAGHARATVPGRTAVGAALRHAGQLLRGGPDCDRRTIDISGDGPNNIYPAPIFVRDEPLLDGVTINALTIGIEMPLDLEGIAPRRGRLPDWYARTVIKGPGAFVEPATDFDDYARAMRAKLLREVSGMHLSETGR